LIFIGLFFFFQFHHFALNYLSLNFIIFSLFFMFGYSEGRLVRLIRGLACIFFQCFFIWIFIFARSFCWKSNFFLSWSRVATSKLVELTHIEQKKFSMIFPWFLFFFNFIILHYIIHPWALSFFHILFCCFEGGLVNLTRVSLGFFYWTLIFLLGSSFEILIFFNLDLISQVLGLSS
jgi:hypothetical protein